MTARCGSCRQPAVVTAGLCALAVACASPPAMRLPLPPRRTAVGGTALAERWAGLSLAAREAQAREQFDLGNVPAFLGALVPVHLRARVADRDHAATVWCAPDYFGLGTDDDWLRLPITPQLAQQLADRLDCVLPTRRLVDAIWEQAAVKVEPRPFHPREHDILSVAIFAASHAAIEASRGDAARSALVAGCKKDVVLSPRLRQSPDRVVIYGWHHLDGRPIQPLWMGHTTGHVDYSHGIRFVARAMLLDGRATTVDAVLADPSLHVLLSDEGPIPEARYPSPPVR